MGYGKFRRAIYSGSNKSGSDKLSLGKRFTVSQSDQGMQCKEKYGEKAEFTFSK